MIQTMEAISGLYNVQQVGLTLTWPRSSWCLSSQPRDLLCTAAASSECEPQSSVWISHMLKLQVQLRWQECEPQSSVWISRMWKSQVQHWW
jgi:hypothetical protein